MQRSDRSQRIEDPGPGEGTRRPIGRVLIPALLANHLLILLGAYVLLAHPPTGAPVGAFLIGGGILLEIGIIAWTARLARTPEGLAGRLADASSSTAVSVSAGRWLCTSCAWTGSSATGVCHRCGRAAVRLPSRY